MSLDALPDPARPPGPRTLAEAHSALVRPPSAVAAEAVAAAGIGVFECRLADQSLTWTDAVYDLFDLPRGSALRRGRVLDHYPPASRALLERVRGAALAARRGFELEAEIVTARGRARGIHISAAVSWSAAVERIATPKSLKRKTA